MSWLKPKAGEKYRRQRFTIRVDAVDGGDVYVARLAQDGRVDFRRVTLGTWKSQMAGAKPINKRKRGGK